jgi:pimeloyl-ACP methyl ester carboxylesterase
MPKVNLRGTTMHFQQIGQGPDLVLVHGLFSNLAFWWLHIAPRLAETHRVTALDLRGHGFSALPPEGYRAVDLAEDVVALMDHLGIGEAHLLGHSFGGAVILALAARHPGRVRRVTLADAWVPSLQALPIRSGGDWPELQDRLRDRGILIENELPRVAQGLIEELLADDGDEEADAAAPAQILRREDLRRARPLWVTRGGDGRSLRRWRELMERTLAFREFHDLTGLEPETLRRIPRPVDLVYGARSKYLASRDGLQATLADPRSVTVPNAGHFFPILQPSALLAAFGRGQGAPQQIRTRATGVRRLA